MTALRISIQTYRDESSRVLNNHKNHQAQDTPILVGGIPVVFRDGKDPEGPSETKEYEYYEDGEEGGDIGPPTPFIGDANKNREQLHTDKTGIHRPLQRKPVHGNKFVNRTPIEGSRVHHGGMFGGANFAEEGSREDAAAGGEDQSEDVAQRQRVRYHRNRNNYQRQQQQQQLKLQQKFQQRIQRQQQQLQQRAHLDHDPNHEGHESHVGHEGHEGHAGHEGHEGLKGQEMHRQKHPADTVTILDGSQEVQEELQDTGDEGVAGGERVVSPVNPGRDRGHPFGARIKHDRSDDGGGLASWSAPNRRMQEMYDSLTPYQQQVGFYDTNAFKLTTGRGRLYNPRFECLLQTENNGTWPFRKFSLSPTK
jgi:hypothetical protein